MHGQKHKKLKLNLSLPLSLSHSKSIYLFVKLYVWVNVCVCVCVCLCMYVCLCVREREREREREPIVCKAEKGLWKAHKVECPKQIAVGGGRETKWRFGVVQLVLRSWVGGPFNRRSVRDCNYGWSARWWVWG